MFKIQRKLSILFGFFPFTKVLTKPSLSGSTSLSKILHATISLSSGYNINQIRRCSVQIIIINNGELSTIYRRGYGILST